MGVNTGGNEQVIIEQLQDRVDYLNEKLERAMTLLTKHCSKDHHDWVEVIKMASELYGR